MLIPIRCQTCGKPIAHLWESYISKVRAAYGDEKKLIQTRFVPTMVKDTTIEQKTLDELNLKRYCCRRTLLCHVEMVDKL